MCYCLVTKKKTYRNSLSFNGFLVNTPYLKNHPGFSSILKVDQCQPKPNCETSPLWVQGILVVTIGQYPDPLNSQLMVGFRNLVGVGIGPLSKKLAFKWFKLLTPARPPATQSLIPSLSRSPWQVIAKTSWGAHWVHNLLPVFPSIARTPKIIFIIFNRTEVFHFNVWIMSFGQSVEWQI